MKQYAKVVHCRTGSLEIPVMVKFYWKYFKPLFSFLWFVDGQESIVKTEFSSN